jgi:hypothetical protein
MGTQWPVDAVIGGAVDYGWTFAASRWMIPKKRRGRSRVHRRAPIRWSETG